MKVNFHNLTGAMPQGLDGHIYYALGPPPPCPPIPSILPHGTMLMFLGIDRAWRVATKVFVGLTPGLQSNWARLLFGHIPAFVPPPHPSEAASPRDDDRARLRARR